MKLIHFTLFLCLLSVPGIVALRNVHRLCTFMSGVPRNAFRYKLTSQPDYTDLNSRFDQEKIDFTSNKSSHAAIKSTDRVQTIPPNIERFNKWTVGMVKSLLMTLYGDRNYARFAALETIARVPYFSYTSVLHLYETLGWFRQKEYIKIHFAESWNELHHLLIMESLGGNDRYLDRLIAQHIAFFYYWIVVVLYMSFPAVAYNLNKQVESHAYDTYNKFLQSHGDELKQLPAPAVAKEYYEKEGELYMFDAFHHDGIISEEEEHIGQVDKEPVSIKRRPVINNLYDVFYHIREDELEHAKTMEALQNNVIEKKFITRQRRDTTKDNTE